MTCITDRPQFRLLNHLVGWDAAAVEGLQGLQAPSGVQLQSLLDEGDPLDDSTLSMWLPPPRLARSCSGCEWYLATPCPPRSRLLVRNACNRCWTEPAPGALGVLQCARAIAVSPQRIAVVDAAADSIFFFTDGGRRLLGQAAFGQLGAIAYASWAEWLVVDEQSGILRRLDLAGNDLGPLSARLPANAPGAVDRLAVDEECRVWIAIRRSDGRYLLWRAARNDSEFQPARLGELRQALRRNDLSVVTEEGFCFQDDESQHNDESCGACFSWYGRPLQSPPAIVSPPRFVQQGQLLTTAIDSGVPRCRWHRVHIDADIPSGATVAVAVSSSEEPDPPPQGAADVEWLGFNSGKPHWADWQEADLNREDFLIQQPPGRYLFLRLRLTGDGFRTPSVQRIRLDFPRQTSLDQLPFVYRENPEAEDFSERFLSLFDAFLENIDNVIERLPALLDASGAADDLLVWLGRFLDVAMDPAWDAERRRRILLAAPRLYRMRGTVDGIRTAVRLVFGVDPVIQELPMERPWGAVGQVRLSDGARLFGRSNWRFRLGRSQLSQAPLRSFGNPDRDPFQSLAYRFGVYVPLVLDGQSRSRLEQLIEAQKPAHTQATVRAGNTSFVLGAAIRLGIDTAFQSPAPSVLEIGERGIRLGRGAVLSSARSASNPGLTLDRGAAVEVHSALR